MPDAMTVDDLVRGMGWRLDGDFVIGLDKHGICHQGCLDRLLAVPIVEVPMILALPPEGMRALLSYVHDALPQSNLLGTRLHAFAVLPALQYRLENE